MPDVFATTQPAMMPALRSAPDERNGTCGPSEHRGAPAQLDDGDEREHEDRLAVLCMRADRRGVDRAGTERRRRSDGDAAAHGRVDLAALLEPSDATVIWTPVDAERECNRRPIATGGSGHRPPHSMRWPVT